MTPDPPIAGVPHLKVQDKLALEQRIQTDQAKAFLEGNLEQPKEAVLAALVF